MECIKKYIKSSNLPIEKAIYNLLKSKEETKKIRDRMILEFFDSKEKDKYIQTAKYFKMCTRNVQYIVANRCFIK